MMNVITKLVEQIGSNQLVENGISKDLLGSISNETGSAIFSGLKESVASGNLSSITSLLSGQVSNLASNPVVTSIVSNLTGELTGKLGVSSDAAANFSSNVVPKVMEAIATKIQNGENGFQLNDIIGSLGEGGGIQDLLGTLGNKEGLGGVLDKFKGLF